MESRSYRGEVYDEAFRLKVVCLASWIGVAEAAAKAKVSIYSVYRWDKDFSIPLYTKQRVGKSLSKRFFPFIGD